MNYLAHLYLAQPTADSHFGNLLGDFGGKRSVSNLSAKVQRGLDNHYLVDKFTDHHQAVHEAKQYFSPQRKRFAGIAIDVVFDHFLIQHWERFNQTPLEEFKANSYQLLQQRINEMPTRMQVVVTNMVNNDWFKEYETTTGVSIALNNIARRIRFANNFGGAIEDIERHYALFENLFLEFFPQLIEHVNQHALENHSPENQMRVYKKQLR